MVPGSSNGIRTRRVAPRCRPRSRPASRAWATRSSNFYLVEDGDGGLTLVDAGLPAFRSQVDELLAGRRVDAVVLTHGHTDHVGVAEGLREDGAKVWIHAADAAMARDGVEQKTEGNLGSYLRYGATWKLLGIALRSGGIKRPKIAEVTEFEDGETLEVPGHPLVIHTPGHSNGHVAFLLGDRGVLMAGDALCTWNPLDGAPRAAAHAAGLRFLRVSGGRFACAARGHRRGRGAPGPRRSVDRWRLGVWLRGLARLVRPDACAGERQVIALGRRDRPLREGRWRKNHRIGG